MSDYPDDCPPKVRAAIDAYLDDRGPTKRQKIRQHVVKNKRKYSLGLIATCFIIVQMTWDITANLVANILWPVIAPLFGMPPT